MGNVPWKERLKRPAGPSNDMNDLTNAFALPLFLTTMKPIRARKAAMTCKGPTTIERESEDERQNALRRH
jgi:hypothetical protein